MTQSKTFYIPKTRKTMISRSKLPHIGREDIKTIASCYGCGEYRRWFRGQVVEKPWSPSLIDPTSLKSWVWWYHEAVPPSRLKRVLVQINFRIRHRKPVISPKTIQVVKINLMLFRWRLSQQGSGKEVVRQVFLCNIITFISLGLVDLITCNMKLTMSYNYLKDRLSRL